MSSIEKVIFSQGNLQTKLHKLIYLASGFHLEIQFYQDVTAMKNMVPDFFLIISCLNSSISPLSELRSLALLCLTSCPPRTPPPPCTGEGFEPGAGDTRS